MKNQHDITYQDIQSSTAPVPHPEEQSNLRPPAKDLKRERFLNNFSMNDSLCFYNDADNLFQEVGTSHEPNDWHLFINSSSRSLKYDFCTMEISIHQQQLGSLCL